MDAVRRSRLALMHRAGRLAIVTLAVSGTIGLAACGSDDDGDGAADLDPAVTEQEQSTDPDAPPTELPTTPTTEQPTTPEQPSDDERPGGRVLRLESFRTPSGNIGCVMSSQSVRCDIRDHDWNPPARPASCEQDFGPGLTVGKSGRGEWVCAGDTTLDPNYRELRYGASSQVGPFTCTSRFSGVTCRNRETGHGFFTAKQRWRRF